MDLSSGIREHWASASWLLDETMKDVTPEVFEWNPPGALESIKDNYLHLAVGADQFLHGVLLGTTPLVAGRLQGKAGVSSPPAGAHGSGDWGSWIASVKVDLPAFRAYVKEVEAAVDQHIANVKPDEWSRPVDLASYGLGTFSLNWAVYNFFIGHAAQHTGEISAIKGLQKLRGYPF